MLLLVPQLLAGHTPGHTEFSYKKKEKNKCTLRSLNVAAS